jgi:hypothetical protein
MKPTLCNAKAACWVRPYLMTFPMPDLCLGWRTVQANLDPRVELALQYAGQAFFYEWDWILGPYPCETLCLGRPDASPRLGLVSSAMRVPLGARVTMTCGRLAIGH